MVAHPAGAQSTSKLTPTLITTASSPIPVGGQIFANANLMGVANPTGTITFTLYGPDDSTCATAIFTSTVAVTGTSVNSVRFTTTQAGRYSWTSYYSGDAAFNAAGPTPCNGGSSAVVVDRATVGMSTVASEPTGGTITDTAILSGGFSPTGTLTFALSPPGDTFCSGPPVFTSIVPVNGNGTYHSQAFRPLVPGTYRWRTTYSGDANNRAAGPTGCFDSTQSVEITGTARPAYGDYDGDRKADYTVYRPSAGTWYVDSTTGTDSYRHWGVVGDVPVPGDYDGDGRTDYTVYRPASSMWYVQLATGATLSKYWGMSDDVPVPADYDGDAKTDYGVFRPATGMWYVQLATGGTVSKYWGMTGDVPVPADYDGDRKADYGVFRPPSGTWYIQLATGATRTQTWGQAGDVPVPADYDGDGKADYGVFRPPSGTWYIQLATGATRTQYWGMTGDVPVPADYDGDGKADYVVFRPASGAWYSRLSSGSDAMVYHGASGDRPVALSHAIWTRFFGPGRTAT